MKNIRIGKDIALRWQVLVNGAHVDLSGLDLALYLHDELRQDSRVLEFETDYDVIVAKVLGVEQKGTGVYRLTLWLNEGKEGQSVLDESTAFRLVARTEQEGGKDEANLTTEAVELSGSLTLAHAADLAELKRNVAALQAWVKEVEKYTYLTVAK